MAGVEADSVAIARLTSGTPAPLYPLSRKRTRVLNQMAAIRAAEGRKN